MLVSPPRPIGRPPKHACIRGHIFETEYGSGLPPQESQVTGRRGNGQRYCKQCHIERERWYGRMERACERRLAFESRHCNRNGRDDLALWQEWARLLAHEWVARYGYETWKRRGEREAAEFTARYVPLRDVADIRNPGDSPDYVSSYGTIRVGLEELAVRLASQHASRMPLIAEAGLHFEEWVRRDMHAGILVS
jgi:hypothetical protein